MDLAGPVDLSVGGRQLELRKLFVFSCCMLQAVMVKLTEDMVVARTRVTNLATVKKLNCWVTIKKCIYFLILIIVSWFCRGPTLPM